MILCLGKLQTEQRVLKTPGLLFLWVEAIFCGFNICTSLFSETDMVAPRSILQFTWLLWRIKKVYGIVWSLPFLLPSLPPFFHTLPSPPFLPSILPFLDFWSSISLFIHWYSSCTYPECWGYRCVIPWSLSSLATYSSSIFIMPTSWYKNDKDLRGFREEYMCFLRNAIFSCQKFFSKQMNWMMTMFW